MRKLIATSMLAAVVLLAPACKEPDPNKFETHIERIKDAGKRAQGFTGLESLTATVTTARDNDDLLEEFATKVIPVFEQIWAESPEQHESMLKMLRDVGRPEAASIWNMALDLDGSSDARAKSILALEGIKKSRAEDSVDSVVELLNKVLADPKLDQGENEEGRLRVLMVNTLGELGSEAATPALVRVMEQPLENQPVTVHREAASALGRIADPAAVDALITVTFRVPDSLTSKNVFERSKVALAAIGAPAVPKLLQMFKGEHDPVQKLAAEVKAKSGGEQEIKQVMIQSTAAQLLGAVGSSDAIDDLIAFYPKDGCATGEEKKGEEETGPDPDVVSLRAVISNSMGLIGDPKAADVLCSCVYATNNPGDMYEIIQALGRVGGPKAQACLVDVVKKGAYDKDAVDSPEFILEPRWEAGRFAILTAEAGDVEKIKAAFAGQTDSNVKKHLDAWKGGLDLIESCKADKDCYVNTLKDVNADWFPREKAAYEVAKLGGNDPKLALEIAKAFKVRDPAARVTMAWLPAKMLGDKKCPECVSAYEQVLRAEKMSTHKNFQASVLTVRSSMARLRPKGQAEADEEAAPE